MPEHTLPERPEDSNPAEGEAFRPWYKEDEHLHIEDNKIAGIHAHGTLESVQAKLKNYLAHETVILSKFGSTEDILLPEVDAFMNTLNIA